MNFGLLLTTLASGFGIAFVHTLIPVHWLPYALAGHARGWSLRRTLAVNLLAGAGHVLMTALLGVLALLLGFSLHYLLEGVFPWLVAALLLLLGAYFLYRQWAGRGCAHEAPAARAVAEDRRTDRAATLALVTMLLFSPCEAFVPVYLAGGPAGWLGFALLTGVLAVATLSCMLLFTALAWRGMAGGVARHLAHWHAGIVGVVLIMLAIVMALWHP